MQFYLLIWAFCCACLASFVSAHTQEGCSLAVVFEGEKDGKNDVYTINRGFAGMLKVYMGFKEEEILFFLQVSEKKNSILL